MIAGPNGSGKTTLTRYLGQDNGVSPGVYINADGIEQALKKNGSLPALEYQLTFEEAEVKAFFATHTLNTTALEERFRVQQNTLEMTGDADGYFAAILADYIRKKLLQNQLSFSFETVMSGKDKIQLLDEAKQSGYRNYLYYVCTEDVLINKERITNRVLMGEHAVPEDKIVSRYTRSLDLLLDAIKRTNRTYLFDNSGKSHELIAEVTEGHVIDTKREILPGWFMDAVIYKLTTG